MRSRAPLPAAMAAIGAAALLVMVVLPLVSLTARAPWSAAAGIVTEGRTLTALRLSLVVSSLATVLAVTMGLPIAWVLARHPFPGRSLLRALITLPMVVPPVVGGVALLAAFGPDGLLGRRLEDWFGLQVAYTTGAAVLAATFVSLPFFVLTVEAALRNVDRRLEGAARTLGAGPAAVLRRVTLPAIKGALGAGVALSWARALGEFGATVTFAGRFEGRTETMPLAIYAVLDQDPDAAILLSLVLLALAVTVLVALRHRWLTA